MYKYLMLMAVVGLMGCNSGGRRDADEQAYKAGCSEAIITLIVSTGAMPNQEKIDAHCTEAAQEYLKDTK